MPSTYAISAYNL